MIKNLSPLTFMQNIAPVAKVQQKQADVNQGQINFTSDEARFVNSNKLNQSLGKKLNYLA
jgi:hypothetical protein